MSGENAPIVENGIEQVTGQVTGQVESPLESGQNTEDVGNTLVKILNMLLELVKKIFGK